MEFLTESQAKLVQEFRERVKQTEIRLKEAIPLNEKNARDTSGVRSEISKESDKSFDKFETQNALQFANKLDHKLRFTSTNASERNNSSFKFENSNIPNTLDSLPPSKLRQNDYDRQFNTSPNIELSRPSHTYSVGIGVGGGKEKRVSFDQTNGRSYAGGDISASHLDDRIDDSIKNQSNLMNKENFYTEKLDQYLKSSSPATDIGYKYSKIDFKHGKADEDNNKHIYHIDNNENKSRLTVPSIRMFESDQDKLYNNGIMSKAGKIATTTTTASSSLEYRNVSKPPFGNTWSNNNKGQDEIETLKTNGKSDIYSTYKRLDSTSPNRNVKSKNNHHNKANPHNNSQSKKSKNNILLVDDYQLSTRNAKNNAYELQKSPISILKNRSLSLPKSNVSRPKSQGETEYGYGIKKSNNRNIERSKSRDRVSDKDKELEGKKGQRLSLPYSELGNEASFKRNSEKNKAWNDRYTKAVIDIR